MRVLIRVAVDDGWETIIADVPDGSDTECYALPKVDRFQFWESKIGQPLPRGRGMIWAVLALSDGHEII
jgi:hypothetical protein